jgi:hypothetical protein
MKKANLSTVQVAAAALVLLTLILAACNYPGKKPTSTNISQEDAVNTAAAKTVAAIGTDLATGKNPTLVAPGNNLVTATPPAKDTPQPGAQTTTTAASAPTATSAGTPSDAPCNRASYQGDVTIPDGSTIPPNSPFVKTWELKNTGRCPWTNGYMVVFARRGDSLSGPAATPVITSGEVKPGETVKVSVPLRAPGETGDYESYWMLRSADNKVFGTGANSAAPFFLKIHVENQYSFAEQICSAQWSSNAGDLACPGKEGDSQGWAISVKDPALEDKQPREGSGIFVAAQPVGGGWIKGKYPPVIVPEHADFRATISCDPKASGCYVKFKVTYQVDNGEEQLLGEWNEGNDGNVTDIIKDLDMVAGKAVSFTFTLSAEGAPDQSRGIWFNPNFLIN